MVAPSDAARTASIALRPHGLEGALHCPPAARGVVAFAHGSGSGRLSPRNRMVADRLVRAGLATLLFDLLTDAEAADRRNVFDIPLLADRLGEAMQALADHPVTAGLPIGLFGSSTGAAAALVAAARYPDRVGAVVSRGGRPDLAAEALPGVRAPTLLIVGGADREVLRMNDWARARLTGCATDLAVVPGATHLFEEAGALEEVARLAADWFLRHLQVAPADA